MRIESVYCRFEQGVLIQIIFNWNNSRARRVAGDSLNPHPIIVLPFKAGSRTRPSSPIICVDIINR